MCLETQKCVLLAFIASHCSLFLNHTSPKHPLGIMVRISLELLVTFLIWLSDYDSTCTDEIANFSFSLGFLDYLKMNNCTKFDTTMWDTCACAVEEIHNRHNEIRSKKFICSWHWPFLYTFQCSSYILVSVFYCG